MKEGREGVRIARKQCKYGCTSDERSDKKKVNTQGDKERGSIIDLLVLYARHRYVAPVKMYWTVPVPLIMPRKSACSFCRRIKMLS